MNDETHDRAANRYGHFALPKDSTDIVGWVRQHGHEHGFELDAAQNAALEVLQGVYEDLIALERLEASLIRLLARKQTVRGVYLWGGVGRGKSFLMDSFFNCAPVERKKRIHFHRFMQEIHHALNEHQGKEDPLSIIAREIAKETRLLCLDEFHVTDITDAMLMRRLLEGLFENGVVLVTTSNQAPDQLYKDGLQRSQFLPAIELIKRNLHVVNVDGGTDYRLRELERAGVYHTGPDADQRLEQAFIAIARHESTDSTALEIEGRVINARRIARGVAWLDFRELCDGPRGKADYIELARRYHTVLLSDIPAFKKDEVDIVRRFTWLVDEFYDRRVKLIVSAAAPPGRLYAWAEGGDQFERTISRLIEMQTRDYLSEPHLP
ncbi:MAG: putative ATPase [Betaproteobacteria bacterium]|nr:putative ATPase [Betaproteobacteria bacterium]